MISATAIALQTDRNANLFPSIGPIVMKYFRVSLYIRYLGNVHSLSKQIISHNTQRFAPNFKQMNNFCDRCHTTHRQEQKHQEFFSPTQGLTEISTISTFFLLIISNFTFMALDDVKNVTIMYYFYILFTNMKLIFYAKKNIYN